jgi:hypothetical protein
MVGLRTFQLKRINGLSPCPVQQLMLLLLDAQILIEED